jgi:hypothetical protein
LLYALEPQCVHPLRLFMQSTPILCVPHIELPHLAVVTLYCLLCLSGLLHDDVLHDYVSHNVLPSLRQRDMTPFVYVRHPISCLS